MDINTLDYWTTLYQKYLTRYGNDDTELVKNLISENYETWIHTPLIDISYAYGLLLGIDSSDDHANALILRSVYEIMEKTSTNIHGFGMRCEEVSIPSKLEIINSSNTLNMLLNKNLLPTYDVIIAAFSQGIITTAFDTLEHLLSTYNNDIKLYKNDLTYKTLFNLLYIDWRPLEILIAPDLEPPYLIDFFKYVEVLYDKHIIDWLQNIDLVCGTKEEKWNFLIGLNSLGQTKNLIKYLGNNTKKLEYIKEVNTLVNKMIRDYFDIDINQFNMLDTLFDMNEFTLHTKKLELLNVLQIKACPLPNIL